MPIGLKGNTDGSGAIQVGGTDAITLSTALNTTLAGSLNAPNTFAFKNKIINGDMRIDQRNNGASVTPTVSAYTLDRWSVLISQASKLSVQQNAGSVTPPTGYSNYLGITSLSAYSVAAGDYFSLNENIEGLNITDLAWGTASAATVTLSFWVRSSITGTFGGALVNSSGTRSYPFNYTITAANTWERETITIPGDTTGTWLTTNGNGILVRFGVGVGSTFSGTAGAWAAGNFNSSTGAVSVVGTNGATFYITGVQLEKGSIATSFDVRDYGRELILCQRYYEAQTSLIEYLFVGAGYLTANNNRYGNIYFKVAKRAQPASMTITTTSSGSSPTVTPSGTNSARIYIIACPTNTDAFLTGFTADSEL
jgi:hypothetical protein